MLSTPTTSSRSEISAVIGCHEDLKQMLFEEFLKEHRNIEQLEKQIAALTAGLQKVSTQLELSKAAPQTVKNND